MLKPIKHFKITHRCGKARVGVLETSHGKIETPIFMPVGTQATLKGIPHELVKAPVILANVYYLYLKPGLEVIEHCGGIHKFMNWKRAILTDSGGFQIFSLKSLFKIRENGVEFRSKFDGGKHFLTPRDVVDFQMRIGSDIIMTLDRCPGFPSPKAVVEKAVRQTIKWAKKSIEFFRQKNTNQKIFAIIQGGCDKKLRKICAEELSNLPFDGYAIGGLGVGEPESLRREILAENLETLDEKLPRYVMGMGPAEEIWEAAENGADMFDCVLPTRNGRNAQAFTSSGKLNLRNARFKKDKSPLDEKCKCSVCRKYSRAYIHHLFNVGEMLAQTLTSLHNVNFMLSLASRIRKSIKTGKFSEEKKKFLENWRNNV
ncbi:MAG: tRNA guanosine(34) transglycosylase Tgt [Elusimicrobia bacterium]|nr:tRNA guanosine(34) transglycosylase Tgt [Elusimicrobiota bacterium]